MAQIVDGVSIFVLADAIHDRLQLNAMDSDNDGPLSLR